MARIGLITGYQNNTDGLDIQIKSWDDTTPYLDHGTDAVYCSTSGLTTQGQIQSAALTAIQAFAVANSFTYSVVLKTFDLDADVNSLISASALPMYVSGTQKANTYPIVAAPTVAGGSGVARFCIDSNGDGTGTAPSEVYADSLQAVVYSTTGNYVIQSVTVDTNRKYIDVKMGVLTFTTGIAGLLNVLTGATIGNAANGTAIKCTVFVKK